MSVGEKAELIIKPEYGYGEDGAGADIPGGSTLIFKVELLKIGDKEEDEVEKSDPEIIEEAKKLKEQGNAQFKT